LWQVFTPDRGSEFTTRETLDSRSFEFDLASNLIIKWQVFKPDRGNARANGGLLWRVQPQHGDVVVKEGRHRFSQ